MKRSVWAPVAVVGLFLIAASSLSNPSARSVMTSAAGSVRSSLEALGGTGPRRSVLALVSRPEAPIAAATLGVAVLVVSGLLMLGRRRPAGRRRAPATIARLARSGAGIGRIARETGLAQDAVRVLLLPAGPAARREGSSFRMVPGRLRAAVRAYQGAAV